MRADAALVAPTLEGCGEKEVHDLLGQTDPNHAGTHGEHVCVVVRTGHPCRVEVVAQRRPDTADLVGSELLALTRTTEDDADVGRPITYCSAHGGAVRRVVDTLVRVGPEVGHLVAETPEPGHQMLLQVVSGVVGADRNAGHRRRSVRTCGPGT